MSLKTSEYPDFCTPVQPVNGKSLERESRRVTHLFLMTLLPLCSVKGVARFIHMRSMNDPGILRRGQNTTHCNASQWFCLRDVVENNGVRRASTTAFLKLPVHHVKSGKLGMNSGRDAVATGCHATRDDGAQVGDPGVMRDA